MRWWERRGKKRHTDSRAKNPSDGRLVAMAKRYPEAFQALYDRHFQATYQRVYDQVGNEVLAQELTAQVFSRAERLIKAHRQAGPFRPWLRTLAMMTVARQRQRGPDADRGFQSWDARHRCDQRDRHVRRPLRCPYHRSTMDRASSMR